LRRSSEIGLLDRRALPAHKACNEAEHLETSRQHLLRHYYHELAQRWRAARFFAQFHDREPPLASRHADEECAMALVLYNTLTRKKEPFRPIDAANVRMYACGPTVYSFVHIGNGRMLVVFDLLFRVLRHVYGETHVTYVRNITDVDDKINARAAEEFPDLALNDAIGKVTSETTRQFHADAAGLRTLPPTVEPTCTTHIGEMIAMIEVLIAKGCAYAAEGHVLLDTSAVPGYGALSGRSLEEMVAGARVEVAPYKRNPADSVLWKPSSESQPGWESPWGRGRPGWHIECSAMSAKHLGPVFDIHGGGIDLVFPHHENELAQSRCAHGSDRMANVWMHNGFLEAAAGEKMSKSLGNFITVAELLAQAPGEAGRLALLSSHYRQPLPWSERLVLESWRTLDQWYDLTAEAPDGAPMCADVLEALEDDLNTPKAIAALHALRSEAAKGSKGAAACLKASAGLMGFLQQGRDEWKAWRPAGTQIEDAKVEGLVAARLEARKRKDFAESDRIRDELAALGVQLKDTRNKETGEIETTWEMKR
jgi:cysteinyl-tRNA synthetase